MLSKLDPSSTALVIIDLQKGILQIPTLAPNSGEQVVSNAAKLVSSLRNAGALIVPVHVGSKDGKDMPNVTVENAMRSGARNPDWMDITPELGINEQDHIILKHNWSAFYGTDLDLQLRRRGIKTVVLCGISTNLGVESTARDAFHHNYNQIFALDAMSATSREEHENSVNTIFPRIGLRASTAEIIAALP